MNNVACNSLKDGDYMFKFMVMSSEIVIFIVPYLNTTFCKTNLDHSKLIYSYITKVLFILKVKKYLFKRNSFIKS